MISFWVNDEGSFGIRDYCQNRGRAISDRFHTRVYEDIGPVVHCRGGAQIFSALDQLTDHQREAVAAIWDAHARAAPDAPRLNDPRRVLLRFELLSKLYEQGINAFRVFRVTRLNEVRTFPVFIRAMKSHDGPLTQLLGSRRDVLGALCALQLKGFRLRDLMVVEFCDTSIVDGLYRKYSAYKIGDSILPCHVFVSHQWLVKSEQNELTEARIHEGIRYVEDNPHGDWLRRVFAIAGTDYGRVDYGVLDGVPQAWEINLNPSIGRGTGRARYESLAPDLRKLREEAREIFHGKLRTAFVALERGCDETQVRVTIDADLLTRIRAAAIEGQRRREPPSWLRGIYHHQLLGTPARAVFSRLFPRR